MRIAIWAFNNIIVYRLFTTYCGVLLDSYCNQMINDFEKCLDQEGIENILIIITSIFLVLRMHIKPTRLLKNNVLNVKFDVDKKLCPGSTSLD